MKVSIGRGAIVVDDPDKNLMDGLKMFVHRRGGGEYEELYTLSNDGNILVTLPGFASRVKRICQNAKVVDERMPMPYPDLDAAIVGNDAWKDMIARAVCACGGVVSVPDVFGEDAMAAAILRAFPRGSLLVRGTPLSVIAAKDGAHARKLAGALSALLPEREIGFTATNRYTESEDVIVAPYDAMFDVQVQYAGVFIGTDLTSGNFTSRARCVSSIRSAARWGICATSTGGAIEVGLDVEGLFGPVVSHASYSDAVKAGIGTPISVVWIPCPKPNEYSGSAPLSVLSCSAMQNNAAFVMLLAEIMRSVNNETGCILCTEQTVLAERVKSLLPNVVEIGRNTPAKEKKAALCDIAGGTIRKAIVSSGCFPRYTSHGVMVVANCCGSEMSGWNIPWRHLTRPGEKTWIVDFRHDWDMHNCRPGRLALNDESRMRRYREMGFSQIAVEDVAQLPFL